MSREIKFRAWDLGDKRWIYDFRLDKDIMVEEYDSRLVDLYSDGYNYTKNTILQQFTGLLDKNGKEIYEGDICNIRRYEHLDKTRRWQVAEVLWGCEHAWNFRTYFGKDFFGTRFTEAEEIEVIGNIFENPELLAAP